MQYVEGSPAELGPGAARACTVSATYQLRRSLCTSTPQEGSASVACSSSETGRREGEDFTDSYPEQILENQIYASQT